MDTKTITYIGRGISSWYAGGERMSISGRDLFPHPWCTGKEIVDGFTDERTVGYLEEAVDGAFVWDGIKAGPGYLTLIVQWNGPWDAPEFERLLREIPRVRIGRVRRGVLGQSCTLTKCIEPKAHALADVAWIEWEPHCPACHSMEPDNLGDGETAICMDCGYSWIPFVLGAQPLAEEVEPVSWVCAVGSHELCQGCGCWCHGIPES